MANAAVSQEHVFRPCDAKSSNSAHVAPYMRPRLPHLWPLYRLTAITPDTTRTPKASSALLDYQLSYPYEPQHLPSNCANKNVPPPRLQVAHVRTPLGDARDALRTEHVLQQRAARAPLHTAKHPLWRHAMVPGPAAQLSRLRPPGQLRWRYDAYVPGQGHGGGPSGQSRTVGTIRQWVLGRRGWLWGRGGIWWRRLPTG